MANTDTAENISEDSPTSEPQYGETSEALELGDQDADGASASASQPESDDTDVSPAENPREKFIPRERFDQRDQQFRAREAELLAESREWQDAAALGIADRSQYQALVKEAAAYGYPDAKAYLGAVQQQQTLQKEVSDIQDRYDLTDEAKSELTAAKYERMQNAQQLAQAQYLNQEMLNRTLETAVTEAKATIGHDLPPELEALLRQSSPANIKVAAKSIKAILDSNAKNSVAEYAAKKDKTAEVTAPEGRGGDPPAPRRTGSANDWKNIPFSSLMNFTKKTS